MTFINPRNFGLDVQSGLVPGYEGINKFGFSTNLDIGVTNDIWDRSNPTDNQPEWTAPTTARVHDITSSSANDTSAGTGARTIRVYGLTDWSTAEVSEDITMNGTSNVATVNSYVIIHRIKVLTKGSAGPNVGVITATAQTDATVTAQINAGIGQTRMAIYGIPSGQTALVTRVFIANQLSTLAGAVQGAFVVNPEPDVQVAGFLHKHNLTVNGTTAGASCPFDPPKKITGPAIIKVRGVAATESNIQLSAGFDLYLKDD